MQTGDVYHGLKLLRYCGSGAFGDVFYCEDLSGRRMAVKIVSKSRLANDWERELHGVINYRRITENAPELLQIFHVEEDEDTFFYTMEAADSRSGAEYDPDTLAARLTAGPLPETELFPVLNGILSGIRTIHRAGFAHRDVKPDNILFVRGIPKLGDIGLVSSLSASMSRVAGTLDFLPPEVRAADGAASTDRSARQRSDLYAFGKVIYCAVTGEISSDWPAVPKALPLSLALKLFLRLAFDLCAKEPSQRLADLDKVEHEMAEIQRKLTTGETFRDRVYSIGRSFRKTLRSGWTDAWAWSRKYYFVWIVILLLFSSPFWIDLIRRDSLLVDNGDWPSFFDDAQTGVMLEIPTRWTVISPDMQDKIKEDLESGKNTIKGFNGKQSAYFLEMLKQNMTIIFCKISNDFVSNILLYKGDAPSQEILKMTEEEIRLHTLNLYQNQLEADLTIYDVKRLNVHGFPALFIDSSINPKVLRSLSYSFFLQDKTITIVLTAHLKEFSELKIKFEEVVKKLSIDGLPAKITEED